MGVRPGMIKRNAYWPRISILNWQKTLPINVENNKLVIFLMRISEVFRLFIQDDIYKLLEV